MVSSIGWLHLSDLHQGLTDQEWLWPSVREAFFEDLERLHRKAGPWDLVLFTGDLTQQGKAEEFDRLTRTLEQLWQHLDRLGSRPFLVAVPGNHDLVRPDRRRSEAIALRHWHDEPDVRSAFWASRESEYQELVREAFGPFEAWLTQWSTEHPLPAGVTRRKGILPGDQAILMDKAGLRLGIVGLNSAFLQLDGGDYQQRLALDARQLLALCDEDPKAWAESAHAALLLSHHPPAWLHPEAQKNLRELIAPPGRFLAHLFGHMHEPIAQLQRVGGAREERSIQGASLFGLETWGDGKPHRIHGYSAGRIDVEGAAGTLRLFPRMLLEMFAGDRRMVPDHRYTLDENESVVWRFDVPTSPRSDAAGSPGLAFGRSASEAALMAEVARYRKAIAADRARGLQFWGDLEDQRTPDLLKVFIVPEVQLVRLPALIAEPSASLAAEPPAPSVRRDLLPALPPEPADRLLFDDARPWALVLGGPGSGKSALTDWVLLKLCVPGEAPSSPVGELVPVRIELRSFETRRGQAQATPYGFFEYLEAEYSELSLGLRAEGLRALAEKGRILWIFDGLDEVVDAEARERCAKMIAGIKDRYRGRGLITSRVVGSERGQQILEGHGVPTYRLLDFNDEQIATWVERWHEAMVAHAKEVAARRRDRLERALADSPDVKALCKTPLLLTLVAGLSRVGDFPTRRDSLYARVLEKMADDWEAAKGLPETDSARFDYATKVRFLRELAWSMMKDLSGGSSNVVTGHALERFAARFCETALDEPSALAQRTARLLVQRLRDRHGVLVFHGDDQFGFAHRALLDYLTAEEALERVRRKTWGAAEVGALLEQHWMQPEWEECLTLLVGQLADSSPELAVQALQRPLRGLSLDENEYVAFAAFCIRGLAESESLDRDPLHAFALRLTELVRRCPLFYIWRVRSPGTGLNLVSALRRVGERWPGASNLRAWALEARQSEPDAGSRTAAYQMALATAPRADRQSLLLQLLSQEAEPQAFAYAVDEAGLRGEFSMDEIVAIRSLAEQRGERVEFATAQALALLGDREAIECLLSLMKSAADGSIRLEAALFLARMETWEGKPAPWRKEAISMLPSVVEACPGARAMNAEFWLQEELSTDTLLETRVRGWLASNNKELQEMGAGLLAKRGDAEAIALLEERIRTRTVAEFSTACYRLLEAAEVSAPARAMIARILAERRVADVDDLAMLAKWSADHGRPDEAREALASVARSAMDEALQSRVGQALTEIPGGEAEGLSLLWHLSRTGATPTRRASAALWVLWHQAPLDEAMAREALDLARTSSDPHVRLEAAEALAGQQDAELRREGIRLLSDLARSNAPEKTRHGAAVHLYRSGDPTGSEVLTELAETASSSSTRLEAARHLQLEPVLHSLAESADKSHVRSQAERYLSLLDARREVLRVGRPRRGLVSLSGQRVGVVEETPGGSRFTYDPAWLTRADRKAISPSMPLRHAPYESEGLLPFFENLLPEGWLLNIARRKLGVAAGDPFGLLLATCGDCIGAVEVTPAPEEAA